MIALGRTMRRFVYGRLRRLFIGVLAFLVVVVVPAGAQPAGGPDYSQDELDQLVAPIALYPDQLLAQILMAATYPLEVVEAARFVQQNSNLRDDALDQALADKNWDPSVQSLAAYPQVLAMMNDKLEWTQRLGDAFLADQARVMDTVQSLRQKAQAAGNLQSTPQLSVTTQDDDIVIDTPQPDEVYVPVYDPTVIYGPWWAPSYPPWFWCPPPIYGYPYCPAYTVGIVFGAPWPIWYNHWGWAHPHWHGHRIAIDDHNNRFWNDPRHPRLAAGRRLAAFPAAPPRRRLSQCSDTRPVHTNRSQCRPLETGLPRLRSHTASVGAERNAPSAAPGRIRPDGRAAASWRQHRSTRCCRVSRRRPTRSAEHRVANRFPPHPHRLAVLRSAGHRVDRRPSVDQPGRHPDRLRAAARLDARGMECPVTCARIR